MKRLRNGNMWRVCVCVKVLVVIKAWEDSVSEYLYDVFYYLLHILFVT